MLDSFCKLKGLRMMNWTVLLLLLRTDASVDAAEIDFFGAKNSAAAYIHVDSPSLLANPGEPRSHVTQVSFGDRVCALTVKVVNGNDWVFVRGDWRDGNKLPIQGWLPKQAIIYRDKMVRHKTVRAQTVEVNIGDYFANYIVKPGGAFRVVQVVSEHKCRKNELPNEYGACEDWATVRGYFYGSGQLAVASSRRYGEADIFKLREDGTLCPWQYGDMPEKSR